MKFYRRLWILTCAVLLAVLSRGAFAEREDPMRYVRLSEAVYSFEYEPTANGEYSVCVFSVDGDPVSCDVTILESGETIGAGRGMGTICTVRMAARSRYTISVTGSGRAAVEIARVTLSRCYSNALEIAENAHRSKMIARSGDAHWYRFTALEDSFVLLSCGPEDPDLNLGALLMDDRGALISEFDTLPGGACILRAHTKEGRDYYIRVHSPEGGTGYYDLAINRPRDARLTETPVFAETEITLSRNHTADLNEILTGDVYLFTTSDPNVCSVTREGIVKGVWDGSAVITAYGFSSQAECAINVVNVPIESIEILGKRITLYEKDDADVPIIVTPENASSDLLIYTIEDTDIASVSADGIVTGLKPGRTVLHAANTRGTVSDTAEIVVEEAPTRYRALLIGEENYSDAVNDSRPGTGDTVRVLSRMLDSMRIDGERYVTSVYTDLSRSELCRAARETFARAAEKDVSLIYISCHGEYMSGTCVLQFTDGSMLTARQLEAELRRIPGRIVLMLDCCASGGAIGASSDPALFARGMREAFATDQFANSKYIVLCSTTLNRESYRITSAGENAMRVTAFARALCDAAGWDLYADESSIMRADIDSDSAVTFAELFEFISQRVDLYMKNVSADTDRMYIQQVCTNADGVPLRVFARMTTD